MAKLQSIVSLPFGRAVLDHQFRQWVLQRRGVPNALSVVIKPNLA